MFHDYLVWSLDNYNPVGEADQCGLDGVSVAVPHVSSFSQDNSDNAVSRRLLVCGGKLMKLQTKRPHRFAKHVFVGVFGW